MHLLLRCLLFSTYFFSSDRHRFPPLVCEASTRVCGRGRFSLASSSVLGINLCGCSRLRAFGGGIFWCRRLLSKQTRLTAICKNLVGNPPDASRVFGPSFRPYSASRLVNFFVSLKQKSYKVGNIHLRTEENTVFRWVLIDITSKLQMLRIFS
ncbi:uncharacterized protein LOC119992898 isoform X2 [Tripterygium wilfordii]|uniref:uncharacterized protein LOC119992898 isoform X2 n=1 Tax=Tripterygium wilfordii TaxID=458696 RepID=UPI0018F830D8|nr:uncharacterized protein LOC119992898 isoform X2 [Tripterygium wilfordii]